MYVLRTMRGLWSRRPVRWAVASLAGALWWWAALRLAAQPTGPVETAVVVGGWGLGLIPLRATTRPTTARSSGRPESVAGAPESVAGARLPRPRVSAPPAPLTSALPGQGHPALRAEDLA
jgi:hypothetical protein